MGGFGGVLDFGKALALLQSLVDFEEVEESDPSRSNAVFTTSVVLWTLVYQRLNPERSLEAAVKQLLDHPPEMLPDNVRVSEGQLSSNTGAYSRSRSRMPERAARWLAERVSRSLVEVSPPSFGERRVYVIDGTTITGFQSCFTIGNVLWATWRWNLSSSCVLRRPIWREKGTWPK